MNGHKKHHGIYNRNRLGGSVENLGTGAPVSDRSDSWPGYSSKTVSSRPALYIKDNINN